MLYLPFGTSFGLSSFLLFRTVDDTVRTTHIYSHFGIIIGIIKTFIIH